MEQMQELVHAVRAVAGDTVLPDPMPLNKPPANSRQQWAPIFRQLATSSKTFVIGLALAIAAAIPGLSNQDTGLALLGVAAVVVLGLIVIGFLSHRRAEKAFFAGYAVQHGMELAGKQDLPRSTPMLRKGDKRYAERVLTGPLGEGVSGRLVLYTYETESRDGKGNKQTSYHRYTLGLVEMPELKPLVPELVCQRRSGLRMFERIEDVFRKATRVTLESEAMADKYEIFAHPGQDQVWLRRLFSPTFIVWLTEIAPEGIAFEIAGGMLCLDFSGHKKSTEELNQVRATTAFVCRRLREEA